MIYALTLICLFVAGFAINYLACRLGVANGRRYVADVKRLRLNPGERLVMTFRDRLSVEAKETLHRAVSQGFLPAETLVIDGGELEMAVIETTVQGGAAE